MDTRLPMSTTFETRYRPLPCTTRRSSASEAGRYLDGSIPQLRNNARIARIGSASARLSTVNSFCLRAHTSSSNLVRSGWRASTATPWPSTIPSLTPGNLISMSMFFPIGQAIEIFLGRRIDHDLANHVLVFGAAVFAAAEGISSRLSSFDQDRNHLALFYFVAVFAEQERQPWGSIGFGAVGKGIYANPEFLGAAGHIQFDFLVYLQMDHLGREGKILRRYTDDSCGAIGRRMRRLRSHGIRRFLRPGWRGESKRNRNKNRNLNQKFYGGFHVWPLAET